MAIVVLATLAGVAVGRTGLPDAGGNVLTGVELASIHALSAEIACEEQKKEKIKVEGRSLGDDAKEESGREVPTWVADARVCAPVVTALAILGADVGVARVGQVAAVLHTDLQALGHVDIGHVGGRLAHADALREGAVSQGT